MRLLKALKENDHLSGLLQDDADHLIAYACCFWESRLKIFRDAFEAILVRREIAKGDAVRPSASSKRKFQIIRAKGVVLNSGVDDFFEKLWLAEKVLGDSEPESERLKGPRLEPIWRNATGVVVTHRCRADHVIVGYDA